MHRDDHYTGWLPVKVIQDGHYNFGLGRWPVEAIEDDNRINRNVTEVRLKIGDVDTTVAVNGDFGIFDIEADLKAGSHRLEAWLHEDQTAFFIYVTRLSPNTSIASGKPSYDHSFGDIRARYEVRERKGHLQIYNSRGKRCFDSREDGKARLTAMSGRPGVFFAKLVTGDRIEVLKYTVIH
jgi:hypothetical protein